MAFIPMLGMLLVWVLPIVFLWWMARTLNSIRIDVRRIADDLEPPPPS
jgi:hypothetical protein